MNRTEHLLWILAEECAEIAQRVSKTARFGLEEVEPNQSLTNAQRISYEVADLYGVVNMLRNENLVPPISMAEAEAKSQKVEKYLVYSMKCGTLAVDKEGKRCLS